MSQDKRRKRDERNKDADGAGSGLSLHPLTLDDALRGAMQTGRPPAQKKRTTPKGEGESAGERPKREK